METDYKQRRDAKHYSGKIYFIKTDCPNPEDMNLLIKNLEDCMRTQDNFWKWKNNQKNFGGIN